jgi:hypothetical protein
VKAEMTPVTITEPSFAQLWEQIPAGQRSSKGVYSVYKTREGGLLISYRPETLEELDPDLHMEIPPKMMAMLIAATEGKGPMGRLKAMLRRGGMQ